MESALDTKIGFVACKILHNFHFNRFWTLVQSLGEFCKTTKCLDMARYSTRAQGGCTAAGAELLRPAPPCAQPRSCSPACGRGEVAELLASSSTSSRGSHLTATLSSSFRSTPVSSLRPQKFTSPTSFLSHQSTPAALPRSQQPFAPLDASSNHL